MSNLKKGDRVRFLNTTGGGIVTRIDGQMAYVTDEDGFETPVLARECVAVGNGAFPTTSASTPAPAVSTSTPAPRVAPEPENPVEEEVEGNDKLTIVIGFEPLDIKRLSETTFDAYLINDSNYYVGYLVATRRDDDRWSLLAQGTVEPNTQVFLDEISRSMLPSLAHVAVQYVAWKENRDFTLKTPASVELDVDVTKFFKLHCFRQNPYFETDVIALEIVTDDRQAGQLPPVTAPVSMPNLRQQRGAKRPVSKRQQPAQDEARRHPNVREVNGILEVDLHIHELVDTTSGLSNADMLNLQIDEFRRVMDANLKRQGCRIVFIHGKGEGVLRQAIAKELNHRYKGRCMVQDASFQQYGFGATQVTIR